MSRVEREAREAQERFAHDTGTARELRVGDDVTIVLHTARMGRHAGSWYWPGVVRAIHGGAYTVTWEDRGRELRKAFTREQLHPAYLAGRRAE